MSSFLSAVFSKTGAVALDSITIINYIYSPKSQICLRGLYNLYTDGIPDL